MSAIGERIRELRLARGWTQGQLARRAGVTQPMLSMIEGGIRGRALGVTTAVRLADALGVPVAELASEKKS